METEYSIGVDVGAPDGDRSVIFSSSLHAEAFERPYSFFCWICQRVTEHQCDEEDIPVVWDFLCLGCGQRVLMEGSLQARVRALRRRGVGK